MPYLPTPRGPKTVGPTYFARFPRTFPSRILYRRFQAPDSDFIKCAIGGCDLTGAFTMAALIRRADNRPLGAILVANHDSGGAVGPRLGILGSTLGKLTIATGASQSSLTTGISPNDGWVLVAATKAAGTVTPRAHFYKNGVWTHEDFGGTIADATTQAGGQVRFCNVADINAYSADIAVAGEWQSALSDVQVEALSALWRMDDWRNHAVVPAGLWQFNQPDPSYAVRDATGNGADQVQVNGTLGLVDGPWNWVFSSASRANAVRAVLYDIKNAVAATRIVKYDIVNLVNATRRLLYDIKNVLAATRAVKYDIKNPVSATRAVKYDIKNVVAAPRIVKYDIKNSIAPTRAIKYDIKNTVVATRALRYDLIAKLAVTRRLVYDLHGATSSRYMAAVLADGPSLYWRLGESSGDFVDSSGNGHTGTPIGSPTYSVTGALADPDTAVSFNGSTQRIDSTYSPFVAASVRAFECWVYWNSATAASIFGGDGGANAPALYLRANGQVDWYTNNVQTIMAGIGGWPGTVRWVYVVLLVDEGADTAELYLNNVSQGVKSATAPYATPGNLQVAAAQGGADWWPGVVDEFVVYEHTLTSTQIRTHFAASLPPIGLADVKRRKPVRQPEALTIP